MYAAAVSADYRQPPLGYGSQRLWRHITRGYTCLSPPHSPKPWRWMAGPRIQRRGLGAWTRIHALTHTQAGALVCGGYKGSAPQKPSLQSHTPASYSIETPVFESRWLCRSGTRSVTIVITRLGRLFLRFS